MTNKANKKTNGTVAVPVKPTKESRASRRPRMTKKAKLISLLSAGSGADVPGLSKKLGWLPHSTRAALTGLRKSGYEIRMVKPRNGKPTRYHIDSVPAKQNI